MDKDFSFSQNKDKDRKKNGKEKAWWQPALLMFVKMSGWIVFPVIGAVFVGKLIDAEWNTSPWGFAITVGVAFLLSIYGVVRNAQQEYKRIEEEENKDKNKDKSEKENF